ncbi:hypothetical protein Tco_0090433 [Tanacetum coccineum]
MLDGSWLGSLGQGGGDFIEERATGNTNIKQCLRKVADGTYGSSTSCGRDGLRAQHILDALCEEGSATATDLLKVIVTPSNLSMQRNIEYPKALHYWVNSTRSENDY